MRAPRARPSNASTRSSRGAKRRSSATANGPRSALTEAVTLVASTHVPDDVVEAAAEVFAPAELSKLLYAIIEINAWNRLAVTLRSPEPGTYQVPAGGPAATT